MSWHRRLTQGWWRLKICIVWRGRSGWWCNECAECRWRIENAMWICTVFWVYRSWRMWWGIGDWGGLCIWSIRVWMMVSACRNMEVAGVRRIRRCRRRNRKPWRECVDDDMEVVGLHPKWQYSGICVGTSYGQTSNSSLVWKIWTFSK